MEYTNVFDNSLDFAELQPELLLEIFTFLDFSTLKSIRAVNKYFQSLGSDNSLWHERLRADFKFDEPYFEGVETAPLYWFNGYRFFATKEPRPLQLTVVFCDGGDQGVPPDDILHDGPPAYMTRMGRYKNVNFVLQPAPPQEECVASSLSVHVPSSISYTCGVNSVVLLASDRYPAPEQLTFYDSVSKAEFDACVAERETAKRAEGCLLTPVCGLFDLQSAIPAATSNQRHLGRTFSCSFRPTRFKFLVLKLLNSSASYDPVDRMGAPANIDVECVVVHGRTKVEPAPVRTRRRRRSLLHQLLFAELAADAAAAAPAADQASDLEDNDDEGEQPLMTLMQQPEYMSDDEDDEDEYAPSQESEN